MNRGVVYTRVPHDARGTHARVPVSRRSAGPRRRSVSPRPRSASPRRHGSRSPRRRSRSPRGSISDPPPYDSHRPPLSELQETKYDRWKSPNGETITPGHRAWDCIPEYLDSSSRLKMLVWTKFLQQMVVDPKTCSAEARYDMMTVFYMSVKDAGRMVDLSRSSDERPRKFCAEGWTAQLRLMKMHKFRLAEYFPDNEPFEVPLKED